MAATCSYSVCGLFFKFGRLKAVVSERTCYVSHGMLSSTNTFWHFNNTFNATFMIKSCKFWLPTVSFGYYFCGMCALSQYSWLQFCTLWRTFDMCNIVTAENDLFALLVTCNISRRWLRMLATARHVWASRFADFVQFPTIISGTYLTIICWPFAPIPYCWICLWISEDRTWLSAHTQHTHSRQVPLVPSCTAGPLSLCSDSENPLSVIDTWCASVTLIVSVRAVECTVICWTVVCTCVVVFVNIPDWWCPGVLVVCRCATQRRLQAFDIYHH